MNLFPLKPTLKSGGVIAREVSNLGNMSAKMHLNGYVVMFVCQHKNAYVVIYFFFPIRLCCFRKTKISDYVVASNFVRKYIKITHLWFYYFPLTKKKKKKILLVLVGWWLHATSFPKFVVALWLRESLVHFLQALRAITKLETLAGSM